jgi:photosystem II stability/assembly factor-like uncharacterized protein
MKTILLSISLLLLLVSHAAAQSNEWGQLNGPYGGTISGAVVNAAGDIFAATDNGVYQSKDGAATWQRKNAGIPLTSILTIAIAPNGTLFAGTTDLGLFRSVDNATTWERVNTEAFDAYVGQIVLRHGTSEIIEGTGSEVYRSIDNGSTWQGLGFSIGPDAVAIDSSGNVLVVMQGLLLRSTNPTRTMWDTLDITTVDSAVRTLAVANNGDIILGTAGSGLYKSDDKGVTWSKIPTGLNDSNARMTATAPDGTIALGTRDGRLLLGDVSGSGWREVLQRFQVIYDIKFQASPSPLLLSTSDGFFLSHDSGATWQRSVEGLTSTFISTLSRRTDGTIFAGTYNGRLFLTTNNGTSWERSSLDLDRRLSVSSIAFIQGTEVMLGTIGDGAWYSPDNGATWRRRGTSLSQGVIVNTILVSRSGAIIVASDSGRMHRSLDNGTTWSTVVVDTLQNMLSLAQDSSGRIIVGTSLDVVASTDDGISWFPSGTGITSRFVYSVAASRTGTLYAGAYNGNVFRSTDSGATWTKSTADRDAVIIITLAVDTNGVVFAGASNRGPYRSDDKGLTWRPYSSGLTSRSSYGFIFDAEGRLYTGTAGAGVFRSINRTSSLPTPPIAEAPTSFNWHHENDLLRITLNLHTQQELTLDLFSMRGELVTSLRIDEPRSGENEIVISTKDMDMGVYLCRVRGDRGVVVDGVVRVVR